MYEPGFVIDILLNVGALLFNTLYKEVHVDASSDPAICKFLSIVVESPNNENDVIV